jgi:type I restriction enzyme R subunit
MAKQPEQILEEQLVAQLQRLGYGMVYIEGRERNYLANLKTAIRKTQQHSVQLKQNLKKC